MREAPAGYVYRDCVVSSPQTQLVEALLLELRRAPVDSTALVSSLLAAAALETALADVADPIAIDAAAVTDLVAAAFVGRSVAQLEGLGARVDRWRSARQLRTSVPESFAFYALSPRVYANAAVAALSTVGPVMVVGLRTIGTTLSAVARAALEDSGHDARRITVRPHGHPYSRVVSFTEKDCAAIARADCAAAHFLVADEGPGNSGSSFLAVGEALLERGVPASRITLLGTRRVDPQLLVAPDAARRFRRFRFCCTSDLPTRPEPDGHDLSGGRWCARLRSGLPPVPVWPATERRKFLSFDGRVLRKYAGLGPYGRRVHARAAQLSADGFVPAPLGSVDNEGFLSLRFIEARALCLGDSSLELVDHLGRYIAARTRLPLPAAIENDPERALFEMVRVNVGLELGDGAVPARGPAFERLAVVDGRLMPHEWVVDRRRTLFKTDATDHGDDHFFPGPTDVAWDLAGAIVEWKLAGAARARLLWAYRSASGEDPARRLPDFVIAYAAFRARYCVIAAHSCTGKDSRRWREARRGYTEALRRAIVQARRHA
jgi:hypothetical protein